MQVPSPERQHAVMIEAVENHMPEVIVIDEIGTELEAAAARTIAERGVQLVATAHGITLANLIMNPTLSDLLGGVQAVTLSDEEARRRGTQKTVLERKAPPTFDILVEIQDRDRLAVYPDLAAVVDRFLSGVPLRPEVRLRSKDGSVRVEKASSFEDSTAGGGEKLVWDKEVPRSKRGGLRLPTRIYPFGISRTRLERAINETGVPARLADQPAYADLILSLKTLRKRQPKMMQQARDRGAEFCVLRNNTLAQIKRFLNRRYPAGRARGPDYCESSEAALRQAEDAVVQVQRSGRPAELAPQNSYLRRLQHELIQEHGLVSESVGEEPFRYVVVVSDPGSDSVGS
jgi:hypothetical protein